MDGGLRLRVLGPVVISVDEDVLLVRRPLERGLLVRLALARGVAVPDERLAEDLWDDDGDDARIGRLRVVASRLRRTLGPAADALVRSGGGYRVTADVVDLREATTAADRIRAAVRAGDHGSVRAAAAAALGHWRAATVSDLRVLPFGRIEGERLDAWRRDLTVLRLGADIALGAGAEIVAELGDLAARDPLHEPLRGMLATALYRSGRQADALAELAALRRVLADELGVDPTPDTAELELRLLRHDPALRPSRPGSARPAAADVGPAVARGMVGRRSELDRIAGRLDAAMAGEPGVVLVEGPPGIGRTRLLEAVADLGERQGMTVLRGRSTMAGGAPAFWPWRQALRQWRKRTDPAVAAPVLARTGGPVTRIVPELGPDIDAVTATATGTAPTTPTPDDRFGLFEHVVAFLNDAAAAGPGLLVLLDDLHLADLASLLLLAHVARGESASALLVAASLRPHELSDDRVEARAEVLRQPAATRVELVGLPAVAVAEQLALVMGQACAPDVADAVALRTGGNPLFVREIGRAMAAGDDRMPSGIRDAVRSRLDALPPTVRAVLTAAAVLAGEVDADVVAAAVDEPLDDVLDRLDEAVTAGLLQRSSRSGRYGFAHEIVHDAVGLDVGRGERARMHLRAAERLESTGAGAYPIAYHRLEALPLGDRDRAVRAATDAADLALRQYAFEDAVGLYGRAIEVAADPARAGLLLDKARAQYLGHDVSGAMRAGEEVVALAEHLDDPALLGRAATALPDLGDPAWLAASSRWCHTALAALAPADSPLRAQLLAQLAVCAAWVDDRIGADGVDKTGVAALAMATRVDDAGATFTALRARQLARSGPDGTLERLGLGDQMLGLVHRVGDPAELWGRLWRFDALVQLGRIDDADTELDLLEPVVARMRQPLAGWHLVRSRAALLSGRGRFPDAVAAADEAVRIAERGRHRAGEYPAHALRLSIRLLTGEPIDPVVSEIERSQPPPHILSMMAARWHALHGDLRDAERAWARFPRPETTALKPFMHVMFHAVSGELAATLGDESAADHAYSQLAPHAQLHSAAGAGVSATGGSLHLVLGTIAAARDRTDTAIDHLRAAVTANEASGLAPYVALAQVRLGVELRRRSGPGDVEEAVAVGAGAARTAVRLGMPL